MEIRAYVTVLQTFSSEKSTFQTAWNHTLRNELIHHGPWWISWRLYTISLRPWWFYYWMHKIIFCVMNPYIPWWITSEVQNAQFFLTFFFLHTLRHDFVPWVMIFLRTLLNEIITGGNDSTLSSMIFSVLSVTRSLRGVMILHFPVWFFRHAVTRLNKPKRGCACKKARFRIRGILYFTPNTLQL